MPPHTTPDTSKRPSALSRRQALIRGAGLIAAVTTTGVLLDTRGTPAAAAPAAGDSQLLWQWCRNCMGLFYLGGGDNGRCPAGGGHDSTGSGNYVMYFNYYSRDVSGAQHLWQWCRNCMGLFYLGGGDNGRCRAGGGHDSTGSADYDMPTANWWSIMQPGWQWCRNCMGLFYLGGGNNGRCPAGGGHDSTGSGRYWLQHY